MNNKHPRGYFERILVLDCETSGMAFGVDDPSYNPKTKEEYQAIAWGFIIANAQTLKPIEEVYIEVKHDPRYTWDDRAQKIHGLSREYLQANGMLLEDAVIEIGTLILKHWGPESPVCVAGHNAITFDMPFLKRTLRSQGLEVKFGNRHVDTNSIGFTAFQTYNSDDLFSMVGLPERDPTKHNALVDARNVLKVLQVTRSIYNKVLGE